MGLRWFKQKLRQKKDARKGRERRDFLYRKSLVKADSSEFDPALGDFWKGDSLLDQPQAQELKKRLLFKISTLPPRERYSNDFYRLVNEFRGASDSIRIPSHFKASLRRKLLQSHPQTVFSSNNFQTSIPFFARLRVAFSVVVLFFFVLTTFFFLPFQIPVTKAAHLTYLEEVTGPVFILRKGFKYAATPQFSLQEGDIILTKSGGFATIRFFDDSTSRLDENTQLSLEHLSLSNQVDDVSPDISTQVEVLLDSGRLWTRVLHLIGDESHFMVDTQYTSVTATKKAAFDVHTDPTSSHVAVFDNVVDLAPHKENNPNDASDNQPKSLTAGFQVELSSKTFRTSLIDTSSDSSIHPTDVSIPSQNMDLIASSWIESNLAKDKIHAEKVSQEREESVTDTSAQNDTTSVVSTDAVPSQNELGLQKASFIHQYNNFIQGQRLLMQDQLSDGMKLLLQFENEVRTFMVHYPDLLAKSQPDAQALKSFVEQKLAEQKQNLAPFLPNDPLYPAKEVLEETELLLSQNNLDRTFLSLSQTEDKLLEMQDLVQQGNIDLAKRLLDRYQGQMRKIVFDLDEEDRKNFSQKLIALFGKEIQQMKILTVLEQSFDGTPREVLVKIRHDLLLHLRTAIRSPNHLLPAYLILKLKALLSLYLDQEIKDNDFVHDLNQLLMLHGEKDALTDSHTSSTADAQSSDFHSANSMGDDPSKVSPSVSPTSPPPTSQISQPSTDASTPATFDTQSILPSQKSSSDPAIPLDPSVKL